MFEQYTLPSWITDDYSENFIREKLAKEGVQAYSIERARADALKIYKKTCEPGNTILVQETAE